MICTLPVVGHHGQMQALILMLLVGVLQMFASTSVEARVLVPGRDSLAGAPNQDISAVSRGIRSHPALLSLLRLQKHRSRRSASSESACQKHELRVSKELLSTILGQQIIAPKVFIISYCQGTCNNEVHHRIWESKTNYHRLLYSAAVLPPRRRLPGSPCRPSGYVSTQVLFSTTSGSQANSFREGSLGGYLRGMSSASPATKYDLGVSGCTCSS